MNVLKYLNFIFQCILCSDNKLENKISLHFLIVLHFIIFRKIQICKDKTDIYQIVNSEMINLSY